MNVLVVTNMYPTEKDPFYGIFVKEQVESLIRESIHIDVFFINGKENRLNYFTSVIALLKKLKSNKYDVIHAHHTYCVYLIKIAKVMTGIKTPILLTFHEGEIYKTKELETKDVDLIKRLVFSKRIKKLALNMVDLVITVYEESMKALNFNGKYFVVPCGIDLELFQPMEREWCRNKINLPLDKKIIFFPASPDAKQKGFNILKESLLRLGREDIHLLAAGNISHQDMPFYMCASDVIVQLSDFEASPMVLKEAMAVNAPVVFTNTGDAQSITKNTKGCFLCERNPQDVALKLESAFECDGYSDGRKRILEACLALSDIAKKIIKVYESLLHADEAKG